MRIGREVALLLRFDRVMATSNDEFFLDTASTL